MSEAIIHAQVTEWIRTVRTERNIDERRLAVSAHLPRDTDPRNTGLVSSTGRKVEDIAIHMSINLQPQASSERTLPPSGIVGGEAMTDDLPFKVVRSAIDSGMLARGLT
jgi:hypothetical protein